MATASDSTTGGYAVMRWVDDGNRLSVHNLKQVIEPKIPVLSFKQSDNGTAKFRARGFSGIWKFKILAVGGKKDMEAWLTERYQALTQDMTDSFLDIVESRPKPVLTKPDVAVITKPLNKSLAHTEQAHDEAQSKPVLTQPDVAVITKPLNKSLAHTEQAHDKARPKPVLTQPDVAVITKPLNKSLAHTEQAHDKGTSSVVTGVSGESYLQRSNESLGNKHQKLEDEVRSLRRRIRRLEDKFEAKFSRSSHESPHSLPRSHDPRSQVQTPPRPVTPSPSESESSLKDSMKNVHGEQNVFKFLCLYIFTENELISCSRTGKRSIKNMDNARPALNGTKLSQLETLVKEHVNFDKDKFVSKFENLQKVLRRNENKK